MKDGEYIEYYNTGEIFFKYSLKDGKRNGEYIYYFKSGKIREKWNFKDDKRNGESIEYFGGEIVSKIYHINNIKVTEFEWISYNRNLKLELLGL